MERFFCPQDTGRPFGMVNAIGIVLHLQAECTSGAIGLAVFAFYGRHRIGRVKLHTWLVCIGEHNNSCFIANGGSGLVH